MSPIFGQAVLCLLAVSQSPPEPSLPDGALMRLGEARLRPGGFVDRLLFTPDGMGLVSFSHDGWVGRFSLWDVTNGREIQTRPTDRMLIERFDWADDGTAWLIVAKPDRGGFTADFAVRKGAPHSLDFPEPPNLLAHFGVRARGAMPPEAFGEFAISPGGKWLAAIRSGGRHARKNIAVWELRPAESCKDWKPVATFTPADDFTGLRFMPDGRSLAVFLVGKREEIRNFGIWDWKPPDGGWRTFDIPEPLRQGSRYSYALSPDGTSIALGLEEGTVHVLDTTTGRETRKFVAHVRRLNALLTSAGVLAITYTHDGKRIVTAGENQELCVWDAESGENLASLKDAHSSWVEAIASSPDGRLIATAGQGGLIRLWDAETFEPLLPPRGHTNAVWQITVSRDGESVLTTSPDNTARMWDLLTGREIRKIPLEPFTRATLTPGGERVISSGILRQLTARNVATGKRVTLPDSLADFTGRVAGFSEDGKRLLTCDDDFAILWTWPDGRREQTFRGAGDVENAALSSDGRDMILATLPGDDSAIEIWDVATGKKRATLDDRGANFNLIGVVPGSRTVVLIGEGPELWGLKSLKRIRRFEPAQSDPDQELPVSAVAVSADGSTLAVGAWDGTIRLLEIESGRERRRFAGHRGRVECLAFTPDHRRLISGGSDSAVFVWDVR